jgi:threonine aldolase
MRGDNVHWPRTKLIALENTHNACYGSPLSLAYMQSVYDLAHARGIRVHTDGARIFNAAVALGIPAHEFAQSTDTISFCLSKGLSAPVGSLLCGARDFIAEARRQRKMVGGGMRQAGILAAAGIVALETMIDRLADDHANARRMAEGLADIPGIELDAARVKTNIVFFDLKNSMTAAQLAERVARDGVLIGGAGEHRIRVVTHYGIERADVDATIAAVRSEISMQ